MGLLLRLSMMCLDTIRCLSPTTITITSFIVPTTQVLRIRGCLIIIVVSKVHTTPYTVTSDSEYFIMIFMLRVGSRKYFKGSGTVGSGESLHMKFLQINFLDFNLFLQVNNALLGFHYVKRFIKKKIKMPFNSIILSL